MTNRVEPEIIAMCDELIRLCSRIVEMTNTIKIGETELDSLQLVGTIMIVEDFYPALKKFVEDAERVLKS